MLARRVRISDTRVHMNADMCARVRAIGFFNANVPVTRAVCADVTEGQARILAFAYISACFSLSRSVSR